MKEIDRLRLALFTPKCHVAAIQIAFINKEKTKKNYYPASLQPLSVTIFSDRILLSKPSGFTPQILVILTYWLIKKTKTEKKTKNNCTCIAEAGKKWMMSATLNQSATGNTDCASQVQYQILPGCQVLKLLSPTTFIIRSGLESGQVHLEVEDATQLI